jgi:hypothetical protein
MASEASDRPEDVTTVAMPAQPSDDAAAVTATNCGASATEAIEDLQGIQVPGYEILRVLGRGGMGVVYQARQTGLNRIVALKMILGGNHVGAEGLARFRTEGEAIARLQHPNIVQIHEVGQHEQLPFFSLEYCSGGSLKRRIEVKSLSVREAAAIVESLARAVQAAHDKGIVHRDLKPANVLLDADGTPKITDFGLAKKLDEAGQTASGAVMGTPSYMAPEQASGNSKTVGPASDVYALGAILYECLTARPPHCGPTPLEVVLHLLEHDPVQPRELNAKLDRELEAICMKCLARRPEERYRTAADLATDLAAWQAGEATSVRHKALTVHFRSWIRENLRTAGRVVALGLACGLLVGLGLWLYANEYFLQMGSAYDRLPSLPRPWLIALPHLPRASAVAGFGVVFLVFTLMGYITALMVRPVTRHTAVAAGLAVGSIAGFIALAVGLGWVPLAFVAGQAVDDDVRILTEASFARFRSGDPHPSERLLAQYPDLGKVPEGERGAVILGKIHLDLTKGAIAGLWLAMVTSLAFTVAPGVVGTVAAAGFIRRYGTWRAIFPCAELGLCINVVTGITVHYMFGPLMMGDSAFAEIKWLVPCVAVFALPFVAIAQHWRARMRLPAHLAWISAVGLLIYHDVEQQSLPDRATQLIRAGQFHEAAEALDRYLARYPRQDFRRFEAAIAWLRAEDHDRYRQQCEILLAGAALTSDPGLADRAAKVRLLSSEPGADLTQAIDLAKRTVRLGTASPWLNYFQLLQGMAAYRSERYTEALDWLRKCKSAGNRYSMCTAHAFEALSLQRLGKPDQARASLRRADGIYRDLDAAFTGAPRQSWVDLVVFQIARREASEIVGDN